MAKYSNWTQSINYAIKYLNFKSKNINFKKKICQSWVRVGGAYLLSGTAQSSPGLRRPFLWETGSPESSVTKETSKRGCQKSLSWLVRKSAYRQTHMVCSVMGSQGLNHRNGRAKGSLRSSCPPVTPQPESPASWLLWSPNMLLAQGCQISNCWIRAYTFFRPQTTFMNTSYSTRSSQKLLQHQGKWHWNNSNEIRTGTLKS